MTVVPVDESQPYANIHQRLNSVRGPAFRQTCVDCGGQAAEWSFNHDHPYKTVRMRTKYRKSWVAKYSDDLDAYEPRCGSCHRRYDRMHK